MKLDLNTAPEIGLNEKERRVLALLEGGRVVQRGAFMRLWPSPPSDLALSIVIHRLRSKLAPAGFEIVTHRGVGYSLAPRTPRDGAGAQGARFAASPTG